MMMTMPEPEPGKTVEDLDFLAFVDQDGDGLVADDEPRTIRLSDYFAAGRPGARLIMLTAATGWCAPCQREAPALSEFAGSFADRGLVVLTAVIQDQNGSPADPTFTRTWADTFRLSIPTLIDSAFQTGKYFDIRAMPATMFVDAETTEILSVSSGAEEGQDPLRGHRDLVEHYLASR